MADKKTKSFNATIAFKDKSSWELFVKVCKANDTTASQEIRSHIRQYNSKNAKLELKV